MGSSLPKILFMIQPVRLAYARVRKARARAHSLVREGGVVLRTHISGVALPPSCVLHRHTDPPICPTPVVPVVPLVPLETDLCETTQFN